MTAPDGRGNSPTAVRKFVKEQGKAMSYHVALDDRDQTTESYLLAARAMGIPHAFIVAKTARSPGKAARWTLRWRKCSTG